MTEKTGSLLIYASKCVTGTLIVFTLSYFLNYHDVAWCLISVILVLAPDRKDSVILAFTRIKANLAGVSSGLVCLLLFPVNMWIISLALTLTLSLCYLLKLDNAERSALAATIIIMLQVEGKQVWVTALERVIAVLAGCILGLLITYIFHFNTSSETNKKNDKQAEA
ncbi:MAG: FUSC family protein [Bacteroidia bacterium]|nr:FUSC family protein [Bacteroidia bacterium]